jgi:hypothetical protein
MPPSIFAKVAHRFEKGAPKHYIQYRNKAQIEEEYPNPSPPRSGTRCSSVRASLPGRLRSFARSVRSAELSAPRSSSVTGRLSGT